MTSFIEALKGFDFSQADQAKNVQITLGDGDNEVTVLADNATITAGDGNNVVEVSGDDDSVLLGDGSNKITTAGENTKIVAGDMTDSSSKGNNDIYQVGKNATIMTGNGSNHIISYSDGATILAGNGDNTIGSMGSNVRIGVQNGNNNIAFWGDNDIISTGNGKNNIKTLDWLTGGPTAADEASAAYNQDIRQLKEGQNLNGMDKDDELVTMSKYVWSTFKSGSSSSSEKTGSTSTSTSSSYTSGNYRYTTTTTTTVDNYLNTYIKYLQVTGVKNPTINMGTGDNDVALTVTGNTGNVKGKDGDNKVTVISDYQHRTSTTTENKSQTTTTSKTTSTFIGRTYDPLVLDFNQDGNVDTTSGVGIDLDGDGKADGAASNGDKMLAMSDINGNGTIDGAEVFGDNTVDPFTGKKLNAENGFDALAKLAESAETHTGISCMDSDGNVNLADLQKALATVGISLGFVSDANNSMLEQLEKVASINVKNYTNSSETTDKSHHAQQGTYTDTDGNQHKVHDVWFQEN